MNVIRQGDITGFDDAEVVEVQRPYDSAWGMYYEEFDDAKPDEIETWVKNHFAENEVCTQIAQNKRK